MASVYAWAVSPSGCIRLVPELGSVSPPDHRWKLGYSSGHRCCRLRRLGFCARYLCMMHLPLLLSPTAEMLFVLIVACLTALPSVYLPLSCGSIFVFFSFSLVSVCLVVGILAHCLGFTREA